MNDVKEATPIFRLYLDIEDSFGNPFGSKICPSVLVGGLLGLGQVLR